MADSRRYVSAIAKWIAPKTVRTTTKKFQSRGFLSLLGWWNQAFLMTTTSVSLPAVAAMFVTFQSPSDALAFSDLQFRTSSSTGFERADARVRVKDGLPKNRWFSVAIISSYRRLVRDMDLQFIRQPNEIYPINGSSEMDQPFQDSS